MKIITTIFVAAVILAGAWYIAPRLFPALGDTPYFMSQLNPTRISQEVEAGEAVLLDVRTAQELAEEGYAASSTHFDVARLRAGELPDISKDMKVYTYCRSGARAAEARSILKENGWTDVVNIGGLIDWELAGGEVIRP